jgi:hypothetical protein
MRFCVAPTCPQCCFALCTGHAITELGCTLEVCGEDRNGCDIAHSQNRHYMAVLIYRFVTQGSCRLFTAGLDIDPSQSGSALGPSAAASDDDDAVEDAGRRALVIDRQIKLPQDAISAVRGPHLIAFLCFCMGAPFRILSAMFLMPLDCTPPPPTPSPLVHTWNSSDVRSVSLSLFLFHLSASSHSHAMLNADHSVVAHARNNTRWRNAASQ